MAEQYNFKITLKFGNAEVVFDIPKCEDVIKLFNFEEKQAYELVISGYKLASWDSSSNNRMPVFRSAFPLDAKEIKGILRQYDKRFEHEVPKLEWCCT